MKKPPTTTTTSSTQSSAPVVTRVETAAIEVVGPSVLLKVWAGDQFGIGECYPSGPVQGIIEIVQAMSKHLVGLDPRNVQPLVEQLRRRWIFRGAQSGAVLTALSGIEIALWDLTGKILGVPVHQLLGGAYRRRIRLYADCHAGTIDAAGHHTDPTAMADPATEEGRERFKASARMAVDRGFNAIKFDVDDVFGDPSNDVWNRTLSRAQVDRMTAQVGAIRDAIGPHIDLAIDMHARYDVPSAVKVAKALEPFDLMWLEEPLPPGNTKALADLRRQVQVPICTGENSFTRFEFLDLLSSEAADVITPDLAKMGGLSEGRRIADLAEMHFIPFAPHNVSSPIATMAAAHLCATVPNFTVLEFHALDLDYWEDLVTTQILDGGFLLVGDAPGLGIGLDEAVAAQHRYLPDEIPFFGERP